MHAQEISLEVPSPVALRAPCEGSQNGWKKPELFSARQKTEVVLRLLRGEALDLLSRALGIPAARLTTWREAFLDAGQEALKTQPLNSCNVRLADCAKSWASRPWKLRCCVRRLDGWRPAALYRPGGRDDEPGHLALHGQAVWPGAVCRVWGVARSTVYWQRHERAALSAR